MKISQSSAVESSLNLTSPASRPKLFPDRRIAERFYLPSLLASWPDARVVEFESEFIIATPDGFVLSENDLMEKILPREVRPCAR